MYGLVGYFSRCSCYLVGCWIGSDRVYVGGGRVWIKVDGVEESPLIYESFCFIMKVSEKSRGSCKLREDHYYHRDNKEDMQDV